MLRQTSLAMWGLLVGSLLTALGIFAYATDNATLNLAGFFYGIPILLGGLALKAAELKPIPFSQPTPPAILELRQQQATAIQNQIRQDVTRYRYGQSAHLDTSLERLNFSRSSQERPILVGLRETEINGAYALILEFDSPMVLLESWEKKQEKITSFFGPNLRVEVNQPVEGRIDLALIALPTATS